MIIDSHLHIGLNGWTESHLLKYLDRHGIEKAWILTWDEAEPALPLYYQPLDLNAVLAAYKNHPDRIVPFFAPDPKRNDWKERLLECMDAGVAGCGELKVPYRWEDDHVVELLEFLDHHKLPLVFHMERGRPVFIPRNNYGADGLFRRLINERFNGKSANLILKMKESTGFFQNYLDKRLLDFPGYLMDITGLEQVLKQYKNIIFIGHGPEVWNQFSSNFDKHLFHQTGKVKGEGETIRLLKNYDNFYCDISGMSGYNALKRDQYFSQRFLNQCYNKLLFGTDNMDLGLKDFIFEFDLDQIKLDRIMYKNAMSILN
ncbi:MAG: hypothetical protein K9J30_04915 [Bacteroidales bacterium]|nr:hypothetical protein [Bacteroidales bacterium]